MPCGWSSLRKISRAQLRLLVDLEVTLTVWPILAQGSSKNNMLYSRLSSASIYTGKDEDCYKLTTKIIITMKTEKKKRKLEKTWSIGVVAFTSSIVSFLPISHFVRPFAGDEHLRQSLRGTPLPSGSDPVTCICLLTSILKKIKIKSYQVCTYMSYTGSAPRMQHITEYSTKIQSEIHV